MEDLKTAYRKLLKRYHPDHSTEPDAEDRFKEVQAAYAAFKVITLSNRVPPRAHPRLIDLDGRRTADGGQPGALDQLASVYVSLEQAKSGGEVDVTVFGDEADHDAPDGRTRRIVRVRLPARIQDGERFRVRGVVTAGQGDLFVTARYRKHEHYRVAGFDLFTRIAVAPWEAVLGAIVPVPTLDGPMDIAVQPGTQAGHRIRLVGRGLPKPEGGDGDLYCTIVVHTPATVTEKERELYRALASASSYDPRARAS